MQFDPSPRRGEPNLAKKTPDYFLWANQRVSNLINQWTLSIHFQFSNNYFFESYFSSIVLNHKLKKILKEMKITFPPNLTNTNKVYNFYFLTKIDE